MKNNKLTQVLCCMLAVVLLIGCSFAYFTDYATTQSKGTAGTVDIELNSNINLLDPDGKDIINPGDRRDGSFEVVNMGNKSVDVKTEIILSVTSNFDHEITLSGDSATQSEYDLYYASDVELVEGEGWKPKAGAKPVAEKVIAEDGKSITYTLPVYALNGNSNEHDEVETVDGVDTFIKTEDIVMLMNGQADNLWQNSTVSIATKVYAKQHENTNAGWDLVSFDAVDNVEEGIGTLSLDAMTTYGTRVSNIGVTISQVVDNGAAASVEGEAQFDVVEIGKFTTTKTDKLTIENLDAGTYLITATSAPSGYTVESEAVVVITKDKTTNKVLNVGPADVDNIVYNTIDVDGNKLSNVSVTIESSNEYGEFKTDRNGTIVLSGAKKSTSYTFKAPESVGELPIIGESTIRISAGNSETSIYGIEKDRVYASLIGDTVYIATYEIPELDGVAATSIKEVTYGSLLTGSNYNSVVKAIVVEEVKPLSTRYWFQGMSNITQIENADLINMSKVSNVDRMFEQCKNLSSIDGLENWEMGNVVNMFGLFQGCSSLTELDLTSWDVSSAANMGRLFVGCSQLASIGDVSGWDVSNSTSMWQMFSGCSSLTSINDLSEWDTAKVTRMNSAFFGCSKLTELDLSNWDTSNVTDMSYMFTNCSALTTVGSLDNWNTAKVTSMEEMFNDCKELMSIGDLSEWNTAKVTTMRWMFMNCSSLTTLGDLSNWNVSNVTSMERMFTSCSSLIAIGDLSNWNVSNVTNMERVFYKCSSLKELNLTKWNPSKVKYMAAMFNGCSSLTTVGDLGNWNTVSLQTIDNIFSGCSALEELDVSGWNTEQVKRMNSAFNKCSKLKELNLTNWNTSNVTNMSSMFRDCRALTTVGDINGWDTSNVTDMTYIFLYTEIDPLPDWYTA